MTKKTKFVAYRVDNKVDQYIDELLERCPRALYPNRSDLIRDALAKGFAEIEKQLK